MPTWPVTLVQEPSADGYEETYVENAVHSTMSVGRKNRLLDTAVIKSYRVKVMMDDDGKDTLWDFWSDTLQNGTQSFEWIRFDDGSTAASYRMLSDPDMTAASSGVWKVSLQLIDSEPSRNIDTTITPTPTSWPATLPQGGLISGWRESWNGYSLRQSMMQGTKQRARGTLTERRLSIQSMVNLTQKRAFEEWYEDDLFLGTQPFSHTGWTTDGASERYVMLTPPKFTGMGGGIFTMSNEVISL
jgi:hypothetical protein